MLKYFAKGSVILSDKKDERIAGLSQQEPEIFGRSKSREEIKAEQKAEKAARRAALKEAYQAQKAQKKNQPKEKRPELWIMGGILAVIVIGAAVALAVQMHNDAKKEAYEQDTTRASYFLDEDATPELSDDGLSAAVNQVYYTKGGYLCVQMTLGNGLDKDQYMSDLEVQILDEEENLIAGGYTENIDEEYFVPANGTNQYTFYISPEHVKVTDDPLSSITYSITAGGYTIK